MSVTLFQGRPDQARKAFPDAAILRPSIDGQQTLVFDRALEAVGHPSTPRAPT